MITVGIFTALGVMIAYLMTMVFVPSLLMAFRGIVQRTLPDLKPESPGGGKNRLTRLMAWLGWGVAARPKTVCLFFLLLTALATWGVKDLRFETDFVSYLKDSNPIKQDIRFIEDNIRGTVPVELVIRAVSPEDDFTRPDSLKMLERVQRSLMKYGDGHFTSSFSVADYIKEIHGAFTGGTSASAAIPERQVDIGDYYELGDGEIFKQYVSLDRMEARVSVASKFGSSQPAAGPLKSGASVMLIARQRASSS